MLKKIRDSVLMAMFVTGVFGAGYIIGKPPVTKHEIVEATDSLQKAMLEAHDRADKDK